MELDNRESINQIISLIREKRVYEAQNLLDETILNSPELTAQWFILAKLLLLGGESRTVDVQEALKECGTASQRLFQESIETLAEREQKVVEQRGQIKRLAGFLSHIRDQSKEEGERSASGDSSWLLPGQLDGFSGSEVDKQPLGGRAQTLDRLNRLANNLVGPVSG
jgi:hypothetical protein